nr:leucine-rich repeat-containing protein 66 [Microcebus murinus]
MKIFCFRVITIVIGLYFTGTMTNPSRKSSIPFNSECQWSEYLLTNCSFTRKHDIPVGVPQTAATVDRSLSFFRVLLQSHTRKEWKRKHLDLSNNLISKITLRPLAYLRTLEVLNLSNNAILSVLLHLPRPKSSWVRSPRGSFTNGLPFLKVLVLQRNKLSAVPKGLWKLKSLQSLDLSFNGILQIGLTDFHKCLQLENLYLKSNKIFRIHPEAFRDLKKLQVVDLSNNALTAVLPMMVMALELPHLQVDLAGNRWQCDSSMAVFQNFISESWRKNWNVICNKSLAAGNDEARHRPPVHVSRGSVAAAGWPGPGGHLGAPTPGRRRRARDVRAADREEDAAGSLALAVSLSVVITFLAAFCLGAVARPYLDRLWRRSGCRGRPRPARAYSNAGFYEDVVGDSAPRPCENRDRLWVAAPSPHGAAASPGWAPGGDGWGPSGRDRPRPHPDACDRGAAPALAQGRAYSSDVPGDLDYDTVAQEQPAAGVPSVAGTSPTVLGCSPSGWDPALSRAAAASGWEMHLKARGTGESQEGGDTAQSPWGGARWPMAFCKEIPASAPQGLRGAPQHRLEGADAPGHTAPAAFPPTWGGCLDVEEPVREAAPADSQPGLESHHHYDDSDDDDDEGSLFTMSSVSSEGAGDGWEAGEPLQDEGSGASRDNVTSPASLGDSVTFQNILGSCENPGDGFEEPLVSGADSGLCKTPPENASDLSAFEGPSPLPRSLGNSATAHEMPGVCVYDTEPESEPAKWHCSLRDLEFFSVDVLPPTPPNSAEPDESVRDSGICQQKPSPRGAGTAQREIPFEITAGQTVRPSQQDPEGDGNSDELETEADDGFACPPADWDSSKAISQMQLLQSDGDEPALRREGGGGEYFEDGSKHHAPSFRELPKETSSLRAQERLSDGDWGEYSEENLLPLEKGGSGVHSQRQTQSSPLGAGVLGEEQLNHDKDKGIQPDNQTEFK